MPLMRLFFLLAGLLSTGIGIAGIFIPGLPGVVFLILAAACFARSNPELEARILAHPKYGPVIRDWRERGVVGRRAKWSATVMFAVTIAVTLLLVPMPWGAVPPAACLIVGAWLWSRPES